MIGYQAFRGAGKYNVCREIMPKPQAVKGDV
jgi:hypothetical protein